MALCLGPLAECPTGRGILAGRHLDLDRRLFRIRGAFEHPPGGEACRISHQREQHRQQLLADDLACDILVLILAGTPLQVLLGLLSDLSDPLLASGSGQLAHLGADRHVILHGKIAQQRDRILGCMGQVCGRIADIQPAALRVLHTDGLASLFAAHLPHTIAQVLHRFDIRLEDFLELREIIDRQERVPAGRRTIRFQNHSPGPAVVHARQTSTLRQDRECSLQSVGQSRSASQPAGQPEIGHQPVVACHGDHCQGFSVLARIVPECGAKPSQTKCC